MHACMYVYMIEWEYPATRCKCLASKKAWRWLENQSIYQLMAILIADVDGYGGSTEMTEMAPQEMLWSLK